MTIMVAEAGFEPATSRLWASRATAALLCRIPAPHVQSGFEREVHADLSFTLHLHNAIIALILYDIL